ncbi:MAG: MlaD family protein [Desulfobulbus sp.]|nr:MlaD family protein [Desulfobulbus sp.]
MSKKANPTMIGAFVLVALTIAIAAIIVLGKIKLRDDRFRCVAYFTGSLYGLDVGAPVTFRGVSIGRVNAVQINFDKGQNDYLIPVVIDIEKTTNLSGIRADEWNMEAVHATLTQMIGKGLRAQLKITSFLTGKLYIDLAVYPENVAIFRGKNSDILEIPTMPSGLEQMTQKIESLPLSEILNKATIALDGINSILNSEETRHTISSADTTLVQLNTLLAHVDQQFPEIAAELKKGLSKISQVADSANGLLKNADKRLPHLNDEVRQLLTGLNTAAASLTRTLDNLQQMTDKDSLFVYQMEASLREIEQAAVSIKEVSNFLQQNPNALVFGSKEEKP